jgi:dihydrolipoamide dehydrogenase
MRETQLAIIGAGPGGYVAALRAAQLGMDVTLVERDQLGGVCLNRGCIPTKAMLQAAALRHEFGRAAEFGLRVRGEVEVDYPAVLARRDKVVDRLRGGVRGLLRHAKVEVIAGSAAFLDSRTLRVVPARPQPSEASGNGTGGEELRAEHVIVATGSAPARLPIPGAEGPRVIDSDGALALEELPSRLVIVGGGAVGCEWATIFRRLDVQVTLVEIMPSLLPREEPELGKILAQSLSEEGVAVMPATAVASIEETGSQVRVILQPASGQALEVNADLVLLAAGRRPLTEGLGLDAAGLTTAESGFVPVDDFQRTNVPHVLAIGDVTGGSLLAHAASRQGVVAAEKLAGLEPQPLRPERIPGVTFTDPEVASVGLTEAEAREAGLPVEVGLFPFTASGRALAAGAERGLVKVVAESRFGRLLGVHMVGAHVGELLAESVLALELEATVDEMAEIVRPHPTLSETVGEAALAALGQALHTV